MTSRSDQAARDTTVTVVQGEFRVSSDPAVALSTVLGSCVAICLHDPQVHVGGMNHFLLPSRAGSAASDIRYGANAMELLINAMLKSGASRARLVAKAFGGANMASNLRSIGADNIAFAREFLAAEGIPLQAESLGGTSARRVRFWPATGRVRQLLIPNSEIGAMPVERPQQPMARPKSDITLF